MISAEARAAWYAGAREDFRRGRAQAPSRLLRIAGRTVRLETPDAPFDAVAARAMGHLAIDGTVGDLALDLLLWDAASSGRALHAPAFGDGAEMRAGEILPLCDERFTLFMNDHLRSITAADRAERWTLVHAADASTLPWYERAAPLREPINRWLWTFGAHVVHGAAVATEHGGALLTGVGGSGKSTTALLCLLAGFDYLGDDWCILEGGDSPRVHSLYNSAKLHYDNLHRVPELQRLIAEQDGARDEKAVVFLHGDREFGPRLRSAAPLRALLLPRVTGREETTIEPAGPRELWHALVPSTITCIPGCGSTSFGILSGLVRQLPVHRLNLGTRLEGVPRTIREFLAR